LESWFGSSQRRTAQNAFNALPVEVFSPQMPLFNHPPLPRQTLGARVHGGFDAVIPLGIGRRQYHMDHIVSNTLHQFCQAGLLRSIAVDGTKSYYDTKIVDHQHFYLEDRCELIDLPNNVRISGVPQPPTGYVIDRIDVVVRLRPEDRLGSERPLRR
jgi:hypothetical protein